MYEREKQKEHQAKGKIIIYISGEEWRKKQIDLLIRSQETMSGRVKGR